jgi:hypothetical protein
MNGTSDTELTTESASMYGSEALGVEKTGGE